MSVVINVLAVILLGFNIIGVNVKLHWKIIMYLLAITNAFAVGMVIGNKP